MIYISNEDISRVEYLLNQSVGGNHILFSTEDISRVFKSHIKLSQEASYSVEHHIEKLIALPSLVQRKAYLEKLDSEVFDKVVMTYFNIIDQTILHDEKTRH